MRRFTKLGIAFLLAVFATGMLSAQHSALEIAAKQQTLLQVTDKSPIESQKVVNTTDEQWDVLYSFSAQAASCQAIATDGENFYMTYWNGVGLFDKFDMDGNYIESFTISAASAIRDFAYDGEYFYGAPGGGMSIAQLDLANQTVVSTIPISSTSGVTGSRHLSYDPELDGGNGGFWLGQWTELAAIDMEGNTLISNSETPAIESCYGSAYDNYSSPGSPVLWLYTQVAGASTLDLIMLEEFDISSLSLTGNNMDLFTISGDIPGYIPGTAASATIAGGAVTYIDENNKFVLAVNFQQDPNLVAGLELATAGPGLDDDVNVAGILSPTTGTMLGVEDVIVKVKNLGANSQSNIPFEVNVDGGLFYSGTVAGPLAQGESVEVNCGTLDMSAVGTTWEFEACTIMTGDENPDNDCKAKTVTHLAPSYCDATTGTEDEIIGHVVCGDIDNTSGWQGGVADFTDQYTTIDVGGSEDITVTNTGGIYGTDATSVWVDWNDDYVFEQGGSEEFILENVGGAGETFTGSITAPAGTAEGLHRMRVRMIYNAVPEPCGNSAYGEVEDYSIMIGDAPPSDCENFDGLTVGGLVAEQLGGMWTTWGGTNADDATVSDTYANSGSNSFVVDAGTVDLILKLDENPITTGQHLYSNYMYVPTGFSGYFNVQSEPTPGVAWVVEIFLNDDGSAYITENTNQHDFTYDMDTWILIEINFDLDNGLAQVLIDDLEILQWINPAASIGGIDYYGADTGGTPMGYFDDVCFEEGWHITAIEEIAELGISIFPNPASDFVNIQSDFDITDVNIYNYAGQMVKSENVNAKVYRVNTTELSQGIYFFQINTEEGMASKRIIIK